MKRDVFKRVELKYILSSEQKDELMAEIRHYIQPDAYEKYTICNIYMDTPDQLLIRRSIDKPVYKEKMRIRSYGQVNDQNKVFIELKKKYDGIVYKRRVNMQLGEALGYLEGEYARNGQIADEIDYFLEHYQDISPHMYIAYDRQAFTSKTDPTLRITFDSHVLWRDEDLSLSSDIYGNEILEPGQFILEIKCSSAMPLWLTKALSKNKIYKRSFSKIGAAYQIRQSLEKKRNEESRCQVQ